MTEYFVTPGLHEDIYRFSILVRNLMKSGKARPKPVIILGPSGAGKSSFVEVFKNIFSKERKTKKVLSLNCAEYDGELVRAELFGYVKGAFTGATGDKDGLLKEADGGILVLEEIGELSKDVQAKLLIALEKGEYIKVGSTEKETIDSVAIVATTNQGQDSFRPDFWYRCYPIYVSPLHKRKVDILFYLNKKHPKTLRKIDQWELLRILSYNWPGNFREIDNMALSINAKYEFNGKNGGSVLPELSREITNAALVDLWNELTRIISQKELAKIRKYFLKFNLELNLSGNKRKLLGRLSKATCYYDKEIGLDILKEDPINSLNDTLKKTTEAIKRLPEFPEVMDKANQALTFLASGQIPQNSNSYLALNEKKSEMISFRNQTVIGLLLLVILGLLVF